MTPEQFKRMRKDLGLSQVGMAEMIGVTENMVGLYERGKSPIPKVIKALVFGLWFEDFAGLTPSFTAMLESDSPGIAKTIALVDDKRNLKRKRDLPFLLNQVDFHQCKGA